MRQLMERSYPEIWIEGELSSLSTPASGHLYFSLKDENSQLRCAMFRNRASLSRYKAKVGDLVRVRAKISVYTARGDLQCIVQHIEEAGEGVLQRRFEELKQALNQQGLFDAGHKQALPLHPKRIGIITSPTGAAIQDVLTTLKRRSPATSVTIYPAVVQGESSANSLIEALQTAEQHGECDVLLITRGGGSLEDLWSFNSEPLARQIYACPMPVVSAVGHEIDVTICDLVADLRAPTPTAAAELMTQNQDEQLRAMSDLAQRLRFATQRELHQQGQNVDLSASKLSHPSQQLRYQKQAIDSLSTRLLRGAERQSQQLKQALNRQADSLVRNPVAQRLKAQRSDLTRTSHHFKRLMFAQVHGWQTSLSHQAEQLDLVSPLATLQRGFAVVMDNDKNIVRKASQLSSGDHVQISLAQGNIDCEVTATHEDKHLKLSQ